MGVGTKSGEDAADVGALKGVGNLYAEEAETNVPQAPKRFVWNLFHYLIK